jgi:hypothetical protein
MSTRPFVMPDGSVWAVVPVSPAPPTAKGGKKAKAAVEAMPLPAQPDAPTWPGKDEPWQPAPESAPVPRPEASTPQAEPRPPPEPAPLEPIAYRLEELALAGPIGRSAIYKAIREGRLAARKVGLRTVIMRDDWREFLLSHPVGLDSERARKAVAARHEKLLAKRVAAREAKAKAKAAAE